MTHSRTARMALTGVALIAVWAIATAVFVRIGSGRPTPTPPAPPVAKRTFDFISWPTPDAAFVITGQQHGYLEPCGCTEGQQGGFGRRQDLIQRLERQGWPVGKVDLGGLTGHYGRQAEIKFQTALSALKTLGYQAVGLGLSDVNLPPEVLLSLVAGENVPVPFVSANLKIFGNDVLRHYERFETGNVQVGVAAVFGEKYGQEKQSDQVELSDPAAALEPLRDPLADADLRILLAYAPLDETRALAERFPDYEVVVTAGGAEEPADPKQEANRLFIETGEKGKNVVLVAYYRDSEPRFRTELVPLDSRFSNTAEWQAQLADYVSVLKDKRLVETLERQPHPGGAEFVGAAACGKCHTTAYAVWEKSKHARATQVLESKDRQYDPECVTCHTTGWEPQQVIPYESGYLSKEATPQLVGNGCENCHGPGSRHVAAERANQAGQPPADLSELRGKMRLDLAYAEQHLCLRCHDADNSYDYKFETYWPKIVHKGVD